jgi:hypothetical protein
VKLGQALIADIHTSDLHNTTTKHLICPPPVELLGASVPGSDDVELVGGDESVVGVLQEGVVGEPLVGTLAFFGSVSWWVPRWPMLFGHWSLQANTN